MRVGRRQTHTTSGHRRVEAVDSLWVDFLTKTSSRSRGCCMPTVAEFEQFLKSIVDETSLRNVSFLSEELLALCLPTMSSVLIAGVCDAEKCLEQAEHQVESLSESEPWASRCAAADRMMEDHVAYCELIELDDRVSSAVKGAALDRLLELRREEEMLLRDLERARLPFAPLVAAARESLELARSRLERHLQCRALDHPTIRQHLPSFACSLGSDSSNERWRPVAAALLFTEDELRSRTMAENAAVMRRAAGSECRSLNECEDEVAFVHACLQQALDTTVVEKREFERICCRLLAL